MKENKSNEDPRILIIRDGIFRTHGIFDPQTIAEWNRKLDSHFATEGEGSRTEVSAEQLHTLGIFESFFNPSMCSLVRSLMCDAVLYHFHCYEIAANQQKSHILGDRFDGWHSDIGYLNDIDLRHPHYVSIFVYLTDVADDDGPFEITSKTGEPVRLGSDPSVKVIGNAGTVFVWNRAFLHRASPNLGPKRRRIIKVSIQNNYLQNHVITSGHYDSLLKIFAGRNKFIAYLLGAEHRNSHHGKNLPSVEEAPVVHSYIGHNATVKISLKQIYLGKIRYMLRKINNI